MTIACGKGLLGSTKNIYPTITNRRLPFGLRFFLLIPSATAIIAAAAAASRALARCPPWADFDNFELPAGSLFSRASFNAARSNKLIDGLTSPSATARWNARISSLPSLKPWPLVMIRVKGNLISASASFKSPSRQRSQTIATGRPQRSKHSSNSPPMLHVWTPYIINSPRSCIF